MMMFMYWLSQWFWTIRSPRNCNGNKPKWFWFFLLFNKKRLLETEEGYIFLILILRYVPLWWSCNENILFWGLINSPKRFFKLTVSYKRQIQGCHVHYSTTLHLLNPILPHALEQSIAVVHTNQARFEPGSNHTAARYVYGFRFLIWHQVRSSSDLNSKSSMRVFLVDCFVYKMLTPVNTLLLTSVQVID